MSDDVELDYAWLTQDALRGVVRSVLETTVALGHPPGDHHFYVEFSTEAPGVQLADRLKVQYPERMTIVLQHQFEGLEVDEEGFAVTLHFGGIADRLVIPFAAITQFADPSASFALQFSPPAEADEDEEQTASETGSGAATTDASDKVEPLRPAGGKPSADRSGEPEDDGPDGDGSGGDGSGGADVVSLDRFRKK